MNSAFRKTRCPAAPARQESRRGGFVILALVCLVVCLAFVSLSVDVGYITMQKTRMQNAVDAAALAAAQEISHAVQTSPEDIVDVTSYALEKARIVARDVAKLNDTYIDPQVDVEFGTRTYNPTTKKYGINWGSTPANVVRVTARRTDDDTSKQDGQLKLFFAGAAGANKFAKVQTSAVAFIESRDLVVVHDFSRSMNFDSHFPLNNEATSRLSNTQIVNNLQTVWNDLGYGTSGLGTMTFTPQYLTMSKSQSGVTQTVKFRYDSADISVDKGTLTSIRTSYWTSSSRKTLSSETTTNISGSKTSYTYTLSGKDLARVVVVSTYTPPASPETITSNSMTVVFSADRKSATISSSTKLRDIQVTFTNGSTDTSLTWANNAGPTSYTYSSSKVIDKIDLRRTSSSTWGAFDASPATQTLTITQQFDDTDANVQAAFGLDRISYPYAGGSWNSFIAHARDDEQMIAKGYRETYGGLSFVNYIFREQSGHWQTPKLCETRHYPFHAIKEGHDLLCNFLGNLGFDDHIGMVSYDTSHRVETILNEAGYPQVNISTKPITNDYVSVNNLMKYKQANHYSGSTNMGGGLEDAVTLLKNHSRAGSRPTILLMTDGNSNYWDTGRNGNLPSDWNWDKLFDYNQDGVKDYTTSDTQKRYVLKTAKAAVDAGYTIHTMAVGADADAELLKAIAWLGNGVFINVPGGSSVSDMTEQVEAAFTKIAAFVPPAKLLNDTP
ncbi:pilus assembly protein TadG-related protein [Planctomicrobium sp. SH664]|uniref:vWA domain-containing protein n=1 Tax=Planctomicrobium sp. SH664 TaxID=3448125 RepID=UPI003F5BDBA2